MDLILDSTDPKFMLPTALRGFEAARRRHNEAASSGGPLDTYVPLTEAAFWAVTLDERLRDLDGDLYVDARDASDAGRHLLGLHYARNLKTHQLPLTITKRPGRAYPYSYPFSYSEMVWLPLDRLPEPQITNRHTPPKRDAYAELLADRPTRLTLVAVESWLATYAAMPGSSLPSSESLPG